MLAATLQLARARAHWRRCAVELHAWCRQHGVRVLHGNVWAHYFALGALRQAHPERYRTIWHTHNFLNVHRHLGLRGRFNCWQIRRGADWLLCVSHAVAGGWGRSGVRTRVVHNCVSSRYEMLAPVLPRVPPAAGRPLRLVGAGRLEWCKGHHVSIEAVARLRAAGWPVTLDLFGGPLAGNPYHDRLRRRVAELRLDSVVTFHGYVDDVVRRLEGFDVALQSRIDPEPCSLYVLECMQRGLPLVASAGGGTQELLRDGQEGFLYPPGDVEALARGVEWLARDPACAARFAHAARERVRREFSPGRFARNLAAFYAEVLGTLPVRMVRAPARSADAEPAGEGTG